MLFSRVFAFAALATALPSPSTEVNALDKKSMGSFEDAVVALNARQLGQLGQLLPGGPITQAINNATAILNATLNANIANALAATSNITNATDATIKALIANVQAIQSSIIQARNALFNGIFNATGGLFGVLTSLTQTEISNISSALTQLVSALQRLGPILTVNYNGLTTALRAALQAELNALRTLLTPFLFPLTTVANALNSLSLRVNTQPIADAYAALATFLQQIGAQV